MKDRTDLENGLQIRESPLLGEIDYLSIRSICLLACFMGGFLLFFGTQAFREAVFPLLFLAFMIPIPSPIWGVFVPLVKKSATESAYWLFQILRIPVLREGHLFHLPGLSVELVDGCIGIRSALALLIIGTIAGHFFLRKWPTKVALIFLVLPIVITQNAIRIVTISLLTIYVDSGIISSWFHTRGFPFAILNVILLVPVIWLLRRVEEMDRCELVRREA